MALVKKRERMTLTNVVVCGRKQVIQYCTWSAAGWQATEHGKLQEHTSASYEDDAHLEILKSGDVFVLMYSADSSASLAAAEQVRSLLPYHKRTGTHQLVLVGESELSKEMWPSIQVEGQAVAKKWGCAFRMAQITRSFEGHAYDDICLQLADAYCKCTFNLQWLT